MKSFYDYVRNDCKIEIPEGNLSGAWFCENHLVMVVACCCCGMTMTSPSAWIDEEGYTYCSDCAGIEEE